VTISTQQVHETGSARPARHPSGADRRPINTLQYTAGAPSSQLGRAIGHW